VVALTTENGDSGLESGADQTIVLAAQEHTSHSRVQICISVRRIDRTSAIPDSFCPRPPLFWQDPEHRPSRPPKLRAGTRD
jgi:hypothetical protein